METNSCEVICTDNSELLIKDLKLWIIEFDIKGRGNGCAVVKALNPKEAESLLKKDGTFNGSPILYSITRIEEIVPSPYSMLLAEKIND